MVHELIKGEEEKGISPSKIIVGGFSQGGAVALYSGLTYPKTLGGLWMLIIISTSRIAVL